MANGAKQPKGIRLKIIIKISLDKTKKNLLC